MASEKPGNITLSGVAIPMNRATGNTGTKGAALGLQICNQLISRPEPLMKQIGANYIGFDRKFKILKK
jgi:hypothetical protein